MILELFLEFFIVAICPSVRLNVHPQFLARRLLISTRIFFPDQIPGCVNPTRTSSDLNDIPNSL